MYFDKNWDFISSKEKSHFSITWITKVGIFFLKIMKSLMPNENEEQTQTIISLVSDHISPSHSF